MLTLRRIQSNYSFMITFSYKETFCVEIFEDVHMGAKINKPVNPVSSLPHFSIICFCEEINVKRTKNFLAYFLFFFSSSFSSLFSFILLILYYTRSSLACMVYL